MVKFGGTRLPKDWIPSTNGQVDDNFPKTKKPCHNGKALCLK
jgi:hypothetical protein